MKFPVPPIGVLCEEPDLAPPGGGESGRPKRIVCEFCGCRLSNAGEVLERSAQAKVLLNQTEKLESAAADLAAARTKIQELETALAAATAPEARRSSFL